MISSLDDAWRWYQSVKTLTQDMERLGRRFWNVEGWAQGLSQDNRFRYVESAEIADRARTILNDLEDLGVLVLFSVFEAIVRDRAQIDVERSLPPLLHPAVDHAIRELTRDIQTGSFGKVVDAFKGMDPDLIEEVNQVRRYRNWVAHGRRGEQPDYVDPLRAQDRLNRFLEQMIEAAAGPPPLLEEPGRE